MTILKVEYDELSDGIEKLYDLLSGLNREIAGISEYSAGLDIFWDGAVNQAFMAALGEDLVSMETIVLNIRETIRAAGRVLKIYVQNEADIQRLTADHIRR